MHPKRSVINRLPCIALLLMSVLGGVLESALALASVLAKWFYAEDLYVMGKALTGKLSWMLTGLVDSLLNGGQLFKKRICSQRSKFFP